MNILVCNEVLVVVTLGMLLVACEDEYERCDPDTFQGGCDGNTLYECGFTDETGWVVEKRDCGNNFCIWTENARNCSVTSDPLYCDETDYQYRYYCEQDTSVLCGSGTPVRIEVCNEDERCGPRCTPKPEPIQAAQVSTPCAQVCESNAHCSQSWDFEQPASAPVTQISNEQWGYFVTDTNEEIPFVNGCIEAPVLPDGATNSVQYCWCYSDDDLEAIEQDILTSG